MRSRTCPICGRQGVSETSARCPQCDAELTCFRVLDSLPDEPEPPGASRGELRKPELPRTLWGLLWGMLIVILGLSTVLVLRFTHFNAVFTKRHNTLRSDLNRISLGLEGLVGDRERVEKRSAKRIAQNRELIKGLEQVLAQMSDQSLSPGENQDLATIRQPVAKDTESVSSARDRSENDTSRFWTYQATEEDTLWEIARRHLGRGKYYPLLLELNSGLGIYRIGKGVQIVIPKEVPDIEERYQRVIEVQDGKTYWMYTVVPGDTLKGIARKFYGSETKRSKVMELNPGLRLDPGTEMRIELQ